MAIDIQEINKGLVKKLKSKIKKKAKQNRELKERLYFLESLLKQKVMVKEDYRYVSEEQWIISDFCEDVLSKLEVDK